MISELPLRRGACRAAAADRSDYDQLTHLQTKSKADLQALGRRSTLQRPSFVRRARARVHGQPGQSRVSSLVADNYHLNSDLNSWLISRQEPRAYDMYTKRLECALLSAMLDWCNW